MLLISPWFQWSTLFTCFCNFLHFLDNFWHIFCEFLPISVSDIHLQLPEPSNNGEQFFWSNNGWDARIRPRSVTSKHQSHILLPKSHIFEFELKKRLVFVQFEIVGRKKLFFGEVWGFFGVFLLLNIRKTVENFFRKKAHVLTCIWKLMPEGHYLRALTVFVDVFVLFFVRWLV